MHDCDSWQRQTCLHMYIPQRQLNEQWKMIKDGRWWKMLPMYVCMYVMFIRCDKRTSNNKHKKQSQNDIQHKAAKPKKLYHLTKLYKERMRKDFLWRSVEYSGSWYECPRNLKLARFLAGGVNGLKHVSPLLTFHVEWLNISWQLLCLVK